MEHLLTHTDIIHVVDKYLSKCKDIGYVHAQFVVHSVVPILILMNSFDVIELSSGFLSLPPDDWVRLVERVHVHGMKAKPELGIQFGAGGDTAASDLEAAGTSDPDKVINLGKRFLDTGVEMMMIESEGITENVKTWRTDVIQAILKGLPMESVMFEAADPAVFNWYVREFGMDVNLFVDHSQIVQLTCLRCGIWGRADTFGKVVSYR